MQHLFEAQIIIHFPAPTKVVSVEATAKSDSEIDITITDIPERPSCTTYEYQILIDGSESITIASLKTTITGLDEYTAYTIGVKAVDKMTGEKSDEVTSGKVQTLSAREYAEFMIVPRLYILGFR